MPHQRAGGQAPEAQAKTVYRYAEIVTKELVPAFGALPLEQLNDDHVWLSTSAIRAWWTWEDHFVHTVRGAQGTGKVGYGLL
ncbi:MAG: hypothetical protein M3460_30975 [Actinomycetota bacterium]|nr:hypothetical protein [Actinomycetota bacterium]